MTSWHSLPFEIKRIILKCYIDTLVFSHNTCPKCTKLRLFHDSERRIRFCSNAVIKQMRSLLQIVPELFPEALQHIKFTRDRGHEALRRSTKDKISGESDEEAHKRITGHLVP